VNLRSVLFALRVRSKGVDDRTWMWLADHLPRKLVYWAMVRAGVHATTGEHSSQEVPELTFMDALDRWHKE